jgi:hypothetical protein
MCLSKAAPMPLPNQLFENSDSIAIGMDGR